MRQRNAEEKTGGTHESRDRVNSSRYYSGKSE
jgi:hypothetical protein